MLIDLSKDVVLIGHPRSGSFWLQACFPHFNCKETFNIDTIDIVEKQDRCLIMSDYKIKYLTQTESDLETAKRIDILNSINVPKIVKILTFQFFYSFGNVCNQRIFDWVNNQDANFYWIKRKDRLASLRSLIIADAAGKFIGDIPVNEVVADIKKLPLLLSALSYDKDSVIREKIAKPIEFVYFEDLLADQSFDKSLTYYKEQNTKNVVIKNWDQVLEAIPSNIRNDYRI